MDRMTASHLKTLELLNAGKLDEATAEYQQGYVASVKKLYSEAAKTYPLRFSKAEHWCVWTKKLYVISRQTEETLKARDSQKALKLLEEVRGHLYALHKETQTLRCNDLIYELRMEAAKSEPSREKLEEIAKLLDQAVLSEAAQKQSEKYADAKKTWQEAVTPLLADSRLETSERDTLRKASEAFHLAFGIQYQ